MAIRRQFTWNKPDGTHDNRVIAALHLSDPSRIAPQNPAGWSDPPETWATLYVPRARKVMDELDAGSMCVWDCDGSDRAHYLGSPDIADVTGGYLDSFFKAYRLAGYKVGCCIRCDEWNPETKQLEPSLDPYWTLLRKASYAKKRWGCKLFYVDSNMWDCRTSGELLPASMFAMLRAALPGCLFMPEHEKTPGSSLDDEKTRWRALDYWRDSAPYLELRGGELGTPQRVRDEVAGAFSVINVTTSAQMVNANADALRAAVGAGDCLLLDAMDRNECVGPVVEIMNSV